jgi:hypothetical protein
VRVEQLEQGRGDGSGEVVTQVGQGGTRGKGFEVGQQGLE